MINIRYHIVSITAVFLALGIGVLLGSTFLDRATVNVLDSQISSAEKRIRATNEENDRLNQQVSESRERDASLILVGSESLVAGELTDLPVLVVAAPEHRLAARTPPTVDIAELADDPWVQYASSHGLHGAVDSICSTAGFTPRVAARTEQTAAVTEYAAAGVGVTITLSNTIRPDHPGTILRPDPPIERAIHAFTHRTPDPLTTTLIDRLLTDTVLIPDHIHRRCGAGTAARTER